MADANTQSMQVWTELLALAAYCDNLANRLRPSSCLSCRSRPIPADWPRKRCWGRPHRWPFALCLRRRIFSADDTTCTPRGVLEALAEETQ